MDTVGLISIIAFIGFLFEYIEKTATEDARKKFIDIITFFPKHPLEKTIKACNIVFFNALTKFYFRSNSKLDRFLWKWTLYAFWSALISGLFLKVMNLDVSPLPASLIFGVLCGLFLTCEGYTKNMKSRVKRILLGLLSVYITFGVFYYFIISPVLTLKNILLWSLLSLIATRLIFFIKGMLDGLFSNTDIEGDKFSEFFLNIKCSPIRLYLSSILVMFIVSMFNLDSVVNWYEDFQLKGATLLAYPLLNIIGDTLSIIETSVILLIAFYTRKKYSVSMFIKLLIIDLLLTLLIFLATPLASGKAQMFWEAVFFRGEDPWLGILFWSTFYTSIVFYLFIISSLILAFIYYVNSSYLKLGRLIMIERKPFRSIGLIIMLIVTVSIIIF